MRSDEKLRKKEEIERLVFGGRYDVKDCNNTVRKQMEDI